MKAFIFCGSPRREGNSATLAHAAAEGLRASGHEVVLAHGDDVVRDFLRDCRTCRRADGSCAIDDPFERVFTQDFLTAEGFIAATPVYWYGMSARLKSFFDRMFCHAAASSPRSAETVRAMQGKRVGLLTSSEETFPTADAGLVHQIQEFSRYTNSSFVGAVRGVGNSRGEVRKDPRLAVEEARRFGELFFERLTSDYRIDTPRSGRVWG